ncbi:DUF3352 domain-containing protein [Bacteroides sp. 519]|uniref:DUF3352 domain-containing protein n=1 Tax=Bacteroides sp. 519 TaxID=2302937 RepID=UPI0013D83C03|nr:DUF3352 domain-containing protein [Bacteroides sp. 519]NDV58077.1 DUF3352 domain-containing protein [Bacteroides sp. 519]
MSEQDYLPEEQLPADKPVNEPSAPAQIVNQPQPEPTTPQPEKPKRKITGKVILVIILALVAYFAYSLGDIFLSPDKNIQQVYLVPEDAVFIIQSSDPVKDFTRFNRSKAWQTLKSAESIKEMAAEAEFADSLIRSNEILLSLVGERDMMISVHKTRPADFDFLVILDLQKTAKLSVVKDQIENVFKLMGSTVTRRQHNKIDILEVKDPETREIMYTAFIDNHIVLSFTSKLVEAAIDQRHTPKIGLNYSFIEADKLVAGKGLYRLFINYAYLPQFMKIYLDEDSESINMFASSMEFAGLYFDSNNDKIELKGYSIPKENLDPYIAALLKSGKHKMHAHEIMSARTAVYTNIGIEDPVKFMKELETAMQASDQEMYNTYTSSRKKIESLFGISLEEHFLSWMSGEFAISQLEPGLLGREPELILAVRANNKEDARKNMEFIEKKIKNRTPIKIKSVEYKEYQIHYIEMKGFFRLFFGKMFDKFEKPYYTYIDDYVLFSNKPSTLLSFIEDYEQKYLLKNDKGFKETSAQYDKSSTFFLYADFHKFYPQLQSLLTPDTWKDIAQSKDILYSFPYWSTQIIGDAQSPSLHYIMNYKPYNPKEEVVEEIEEDEEPDAIDTEEDNTEDAEETEERQISELELFYVEKFQGNVLREFYPDGVLKSETEIKAGKRHGRHREYYESGKLKLRGKYSKNAPKGTWKYYTEEGKQYKKERFK